MANLGIGAGPLDLSGNAAVRQRQAAERAAAQQRVAALQRELTKGRDRTGGEIAADTGLGLASGVVGLGQAAYGLGNLATGGLLDRGVGLADNFQSWQQGIQGAQSEPLQYRREDANAAFDDSLWAGAREYLTDPSLIADLITQAAPSLIPPIAAGGIAARTAGAVGSQALAQQAARRAVMGTTAAQVGGATNVDAINTIAAQGGDATEQQLGGLGAGLVAGTAAPLLAMGTGAAALEGAVANRLVGGAGMGTGLVRGTAMGAGREGLEESLQSASEQAAINMFAPESGLLDNTGRAAVLGGIAGVGLGAPMGAIAGRGNPRTQAQAEGQPAPQADPNAELVKGLGAYAAAQREGRPLSEVLTPEGTGLTEADFLSAQEAAIQQMFRVEEDAEGNEVIQQYDPGIQNWVSIPRAEAEAAANAELERVAHEQMIREIMSAEIPTDTAGASAPSPIQQQLEAALGIGAGAGVQPLSAAEAGVQQAARTSSPLLGYDGPTIRVPGPVAGNANTGLDQPFDNARFTDTTRRFAQPGTPLLGYDGSAIPMPGPVAGNANTGLDQPFANARFTDTTRRFADPGTPLLGYDGTIFGPGPIADPGVDPRERTRQAFEEQFGTAWNTGLEGEYLGAEPFNAPVQMGAVYDGEIVQALGALGINPSYYLPDGGAIYASGPVAREPGNANTGLDQPFDNARFTDTTAEQQARSFQQTLSRSLRPGRPIQDVIDPNNRPSAEVTPDDIRSRQQADADARRAREAQVLGEMFRIGEDERGRPTYQRYNRDLQRLETVPRGVALRDAKAEIKRQDDLAADMARPPADRWKDTLGETLGVTKQVLRGKQWDQFAAAANEAGIHPESEQAQTFLQEMGAALGQDEATASRFGAALAERFAVAPDAAPDTQQVETPTENTVEPDAAPEIDAEQQAMDRRFAMQLSLEGFKRGRNIRNQDRATREFIEQTIDDTPSAPDLADVFQTVIDMPEFNRLPTKTRDALIDRFFGRLTTEDDLDAAFEVLKSSPRFAALSPSLQDTLTQRYSDRFDAISPGKYVRVGASDSASVDTRTAAQREAGEGPAPTRRQRPPGTPETEAGTPLSAARASEIIDEATSRLSATQTAPFVVHDSVEAYRTATGRVAPPDAAGVFDDDGVHVILENVTTEEQLAEVIAHERGHEGLLGLLGDRLAAVTNRLWANAALRERIRTKMAEQSLDRATAAEEVLVDMIVAGERLNGDVFSKIRSGLSSLMQTILGVGKYRVTDAQVNRLLDNTAAYMRGRPVGANAGSLTAESIDLDAIIGDPGQITGSPRFSRVYEVLNKTVTANDPAPGNRDRLDHAVKEAISATRDSLTNLKDSIQSGSLWRDKLGGFVPLNQIANLHAHRFDRPVTDNAGNVISRSNPLRDLAEEKRRKEARSNQLLTRKQPLKHGDEAFDITMHDISDAMARLQRSAPGQADALNQTLQMASFYQVWPDRAWDDQPEVDYERANMTEAERRDAHRDLQRLYKRSGQSGQTLFRQTQAAYRHLWETRLNALEKALTDIGVDPTDPIRGGRMLELARRHINGAPYSPLQRYGDDLVIVRNADGSTAWFEAFESRAEAEQARGVLGQSLEPGQKLEITVRGNRDFVQAGFNQAQLDQLENNLLAQLPPDVDPDLRSRLHAAMLETYLGMIPESSFTQFSNKRKNIGGFSTNGTRAFNNYALKAARAIASLEHDGAIAQHFKGMEQHISDLANQEGVSEVDTRVHRQVLTQARKQHEASQNATFSKFSNVLSGAAFLQFMTSPSQLYVNAMQTALVAVPRLMAEYKAGPATKAFTEGMQRFMKSGGDMLSDKAASNGAVDAQTREVLQGMYENGVLDFTLAQDMTGEARGENGMMNANWRKFMEISGVFMNRSEMFNRQVTAYAAIQLERQKNPGASTEQLVDRATRAVYDTHFDYSQSNRAAMAQGPVGKLAFQFWQYRLNMMAMLGKDIRDGFRNGEISAEERTVARRALAFQLGSQLALTGVAGTAAAPFVFALMGAFDDEDFIDGRTAFIESYPQIISQGVLAGVFGLDTARLETGSIYPFIGESRYAPTNADPDDEMAYYGTQFLGPWFGMASDYYKGLSQVASGEFYTGAQSMLPKPFADVLKSWDERDGVRSSDGTVYHQPSFFGGISQALGARTADRAAASNRLGAAYQASSNISTARKNRLTRLAVARATGDSADYQAAMTDITEWNQANPTFAIRAEDIGRTLSSQIKSQGNADRYGLPLSRNITGSFLDVSGQ